MILKSLSSENFRSFKEKTELDLRKVNVFVGPNKGGKSNVIKCLEILNSLSRNDWNDMYTDNVFDYDNTKRITIEVEFYLNTEERQRLINIFFPNISLIHYENNSIFKQIKYHITFGNNEIYQEKVSVSNTKGEYRDLIIHGLEGGSHNQHVSNLHSLSETKDLSEFDTVSLEKRTGKWLKTNSMLHDSDRTSEYELADIIISFFRNVRIYSSANIQSTINFEDMIKNKHDKAVRDYINFLNLSGEIIDISDIQIDRDKPAVPIYDDKDKSQFKYQSLGFKEKGLSSPLNFRSLSYGTQQLLHILILIHLAESEQTVCIEEPENHIHSNVQKRLFTKILDVAKTEGLQFFYNNTLSNIYNLRK
jgi:AAA15 family ATPase/GTPase